MTRIQQSRDPNGWCWCGYCGKRRYHTRKGAKRAERLAAKSARWKMGDIDAYPCRIADGYHLGHPSPRDLERKGRAA